VPHLCRSLRPFPSPTRACGVVWRLRSPSVSLRGAAVRAVACPERDARVFRPRSREAGPSRGMAPLEADPEAAHSLRPSAGGARVGTASRARAVAPPPRRDGLLKPSCTRSGARSRSFQSRVNAREIRGPRAFHGVVDLDLGSTCSPGPPSRMRADLATRLHLLHPCHEKERSLTSSRPATFHLAGRRASPGLSARLDRGVKMLLLRFYNQRSRHEHSISTSPLETARQPS